MTNVDAWNALDRLVSIIDAQTPLETIVDFLRGRYRGVPLAWDDYDHDFLKINLRFETQHQINGKSLKSKLALKSLLQDAIKAFAREVSKETAYVHAILLTINFSEFVCNKPGLRSKDQLQIQSVMKMFLESIDGEFNYVIQLYKQNASTPP